MKLAITGKGGGGKTTLCVLLSRELHRGGDEVIAIDADSNTCLAASMGCAEADQIAPLVTLKSLIEERTGAKPGSSGGVFLLNPFVADIPEKYSVTLGGIKVLVAGGMKKGGAGCYCPENSLLRALISHVLLERDSALLMDMEAGIEHLSRGTVRAVDALLVVVDPSRRSVETAVRIRELSGQLGLQNVFGVGNKIRSKDDELFLAGALPGWEFAGHVPYDDGLRAAEMAGKSVDSGAGQQTVEAVARIAGFLNARFKMAPSTGGRV
jgi:CO dehydrogenase maturation factor